MTLEDFVNREIATWGEDYIYDLMDRGYTPVMLTAGNGRVKWSWIAELTNSPACATVGDGGGSAVLPFRRSRAFE